MCFSDSDNKDVLRVSYNAPANSLVVDIHGNVEIGVNNPQSKLHIISGNPQLLLKSSGQGGGVINFGNGGHGVGRSTGVADFGGGNDVVL